MRILSQSYVANKLSRSDVIGVISLQLRSFLEELLVVQTEPSRRWPVYSV